MGRCQHAPDGSDGVVINTDEAESSLEIVLAQRQARFHASSRSQDFPAFLARRAAQSSSAAPSSLPRVPSSTIMR
jgi:hypothetical protein